MSTKKEYGVRRKIFDTIVALIFLLTARDSSETSAELLVLDEGWHTSARPPRFRVETLADRRLLVVEGVPGAAVVRRAQGDGSELAELDVPCWSQRWDRRVTGEELSDVDVLYGDAALVRLVRDRAAGVGLVADAQYSNVYRYTSDEEEVVLMDLRPQAVIMLTAYHEHPLPELDELLELVVG